MSLFLSRLRVGVRRSSVSLLLSKGFSTSLRQTSPCYVIGARPLEFSHHNRLGTLSIGDVNPKTYGVIRLQKKVSMDLVHNDLNDTVVTIGASHGWVASLKDDGILRLHDDLNPYALYKDPICIPLPPLVTLPHCQAKIITNVSMSSSSPENDEDCVVAVKFLGPQLSFCKPAGKSSKPEWTDIKIEHPCFNSSRVMFSKKYNMFLIPGSGGHLIAAWDPCNPSDDLQFQSVRFVNPPKLPTNIRELMNSCSKSEHLVESTSTGEIFLVKQYRKTAAVEGGVPRRKTEYLMVYKLDVEGNAVYIEDMGDLTMFLSMSEPFCISSTSFPGFRANWVYIKDFDETTYVNVKLDGCPFSSYFGKNYAPYYIPPQNIVD
ncbi:hypothetical protein Rs2_05945 [Raphanus sativus]|uniref:Uncharacterized protein LOC108840793 n=1 Tax=Raphanus sativus TaxID=3726 RepID=A0A6J0MAU8_RAPSA|nr:uncharacterized protein LOC108840793 [Raphanus sativus]KAJ4911324.1 hypothetical protein Rs2_05945 [Raphanus sativus]